MFGIGFLILIGILWLITKSLVGLLSPNKRIYAWLSIGIVVVSAPFWYRLYPSYHQFTKLCSSPDRYAVKQKANVDFLYQGTSSVFFAFKAHGHRGFKGFDVKAGDKGYVRYMPNENWSSPICKQDCANPSIITWEKTCQTNCLTESAIDNPELEYLTSSSATTLIEDRLTTVTAEVVTINGQKLAEEHIYTYYPYGNGWAKILGLASGSAPTLSCNSKSRIWSLEYITPKR
jgi:hypothetical protein